MVYDVKPLELHSAYRAKRKADTVGDLHEAEGGGGRGLVDVPAALDAASLRLVAMDAAGRHRTRAPECAY